MTTTSDEACQFPSPSLFENYKYTTSYIYIQVPYKYIHTEKKGILPTNLPTIIKISLCLGLSVYIIRRALSKIAIFHCDKYVVFLWSVRSQFSKFISKPSEMQRN